MKRSLDVLFTVIDALCRILLIALSVTVLNTVFGRYVLNATPRWGEETALSLVVWLSLLGVPLGIRNGWHIKLDLLARALPENGKRGLDALNWLISFVVGAMFVYYGTRIAIQNLSNLMPGLGISAFWQYLSVPVSGVLILVALLEIAVLQHFSTPREGAPPR